MKKNLKTPLTNPELVKEGTLCDVLMPSYWIGAQTNERNVWIPGKIIAVSYNEEGKPNVSVNLRKSKKYQNTPVKGMLIVASQVNDSIILR